MSAHGRAADWHSHLSVHRHRGFDATPDQPGRRLRAGDRPASRDPAQPDRGARRDRGQHRGGRLLCRLRRSVRRCRRCRRRAARPGGRGVAGGPHGARAHGPAHRQGHARRRQLRGPRRPPHGTHRGCRARRPGGHRRRHARPRRTRAAERRRDARPGRASAQGPAPAGAPLPAVDRRVAGRLSAIAFARRAAQQPARHAFQFRRDGRARRTRSSACSVARGC